MHELYLLDQEKEIAIKVRYFRLIRLTTLRYKLIVKLLAERINIIMASIIAPT